VIVQQRELFPGTPSEWLVDARPARCPYLKSQVAYLPLRLPSRPLTRDELARRLDLGDRRQGVLLYRPECRDCQACEAIRVDAEAFRPDKTQRRIFRRGETLFRTVIGAPTLTLEKVELYNRHKIERGLLLGPDLLDPFGYEQFLIETCTDTVEVSYHDGDTLVGVAIVDRASDSLSAVYCYFDPAYGRSSPGAYSILKLLALCRGWGLRHLYLGLYVAGCKPMEYKTHYLPHDRLIDGKWQRFEHASTEHGGA
jgi:leucyl-tRNA---protein transferase